MYNPLYSLFISQPWYNMEFAMLYVWLPSEYQMLLVSKDGVSFGSSLNTCTHTLIETRVEHCYSPNMGMYVITLYFGRWMEFMRIEH